MFDRRITGKLIEWKDSPYRKPLVLRGARQVGKTTLINGFSSNFAQYIYLNLENKADQIIFKDKNSIQEIIDTLFFVKNKVQNKGATLIFIDEIQEMPEAIASLRYFFETFPQYYIIAAGSLLETVFNPEMNFPVGRVDYMMLYPLSFEEFLMAIDEKQALDQYHKMPIDSFAYDKLFSLFHTYTLIGGMPEAVKRYSERRDLIAIKPVYESLLLSFVDDVEKYARNATQTQIMRHAIRACFREAGSRIRFHGFGSSVYGSREMGEALRTLEKAKLIYLVYPTIQTNLPFLPDFRKSPRLQIIDTGLMNYYAGIQKELFLAKDLTKVYNGRIIEHIAGQEIIANNDDLLRSLLFWVREKEGSTSELDYLFVDEGIAIPVEIKSGKTGRLRSLQQYIDQTNTKLAIRLYSGPFQMDELKTIKGTPFHLLNIPYFLAGKLQSYLHQYRHLK